MFSILIADDEKELVETLGDAFTLAIPSVSIIKAHDGMEAYRKSRNQSFNLICTDLRMPKLNGADFIRALREQLPNQHTPIFLISGFTQNDLKITSDTKNLYVFEKPFIVQDIIKKAQEVMSKGPVPQAKKVQLDVNFINPFIDATQFVLMSFGGLKDLKVQKPYLLKKGDKLGVEITGVIPLMSPHFKGTFSVGFPASTFLFVASTMLGEQHLEISPIIEDAAAELANIIYGQSKIKLNDRGYELGLSPPTIIRGKDHAVISQDGSATMVVPFESSHGPVYIQIGL